MGEGRLKLKDKVVIITGGAQGIGRAYALGMADEGAKIVVADINLDAGETTVRDIKAKGTESLALKTDVSSPESTQITSCSKLLFRIYYPLNDR